MSEKMVNITTELLYYDKGRGRCYVNNPDGIIWLARSSLRNYDHDKKTHIVTFQISVILAEEKGLLGDE